ncbi:MAG: tetratricopeptide repeat protein [Alphaproteobacteria bacterium]|nr:tetratricopeptide repeat protein [Alphaproteobacteria bacterium]
MPSHSHGFDQAVRQQLAGDAAGAVGVYDGLIAAEPAHFRAHYNRGIALAGLGRGGEAMLSYALALIANGAYPSAYINLAGLCEQAGLADKAREVLRLGMERCPAQAPLHNNLAKLLMDGGDAEGARRIYREAIDLDPALVPAWMGLARACYELGRVEDALNAYERALALEPAGESTCGILNGIGVMVRALGRTEEARQWFLRAIGVNPLDPDAHNNLGLTLRQQGAFAEALDCFRKSLELRPDASYVYDNYLFCMQYDPGITPARMLEAARGWNRFAAAVSPLAEAERSWDPERRLRVGYVSPDFREHACCYYLEPLIRAHDRRSVEVFCYAELNAPDGVSERIRQSADHWRFTNGHGDAEVAALIRSDGIDILVDCAGHSGGNRLMVFAHRPAPVQVATLIGYSVTTGADVIDYLLGDPYLTPPDHDGDFSETVVRLPRTIAPFLPRTSWPEVAPAQGEAPVFGCVADPARVDRRTIGLWGELLSRVPGSRVLFKSALFSSADARETWRGRLGELAGRVDLEGVPGGWGKNMDVYARFSVVLDSPMHSGNTTVLIPLWMGVPVVTLAGPNAWQRAGASILANAGLSDLVAGNDRDYVDIAARLAQDRARLDRLRRELRSSMERSPVCDIALFTADLDAVYRDLWRKACAGRRSLEPN